MKRKKHKHKDKDLKRVNNQALRFNNKELSAINLYCEKYKITNKSKFMREAIISTVLQKFDEDYPVLFEFDKPNLFNS